MLRFRSRKEAEEAGVLRQPDESRNTAPLPRRLNEDKPVRQPRRRAKAEPGATDPTGSPVPRRTKRHRRADSVEQPGLGGSLGQPGGAFSLDFAPAPVLSVEPRLEVGESAGPQASRVLLDCVALPMPPSINAYWQTRIVWSDEKQRNFAIPYVTHAGKDYQKLIRELMLERKAWYRSPHPLALKILCCFRDDKGHDIDNRVKVLQDALKNGFVMVDDKQIKRLEVREGPRTNPSTVWVRLEEMLPDRTANLAWIRSGS